MNHDDETPDGPGELCVPYVHPRTESDDKDRGHATSETDREAGARVRRPPAGMRRRDRREWRALEAARVQRLRADAHRVPGDSYRGGFITPPPQRMDRRTRKAWLAGEREGARQWWERRRTNPQDLATRERGGLVLALLLAGLCAWWVISGLTSTHHAASSNPTAVMPPVANSSTSVAASPVEAPIVPAAASTSAAASASPVRTVGPAGEPGKLGTLDHGWEPAPSGGVAPVPAVTAATPVNPASVPIVPAPTAAISKADTATATAAMAAWAARMCSSSWRQPYGTDQRSVQALMTDTEWKAFDPATDTAGRKLWAGIVSLKQVRRCGPISVVASPDQPISSGIAYVHYQADRVLTSDQPGFAPVVEPMAGQRMVVQQSDGRWLVGHDVVGG